jgi:hypothetical protein
VFPLPSLAIGVRLVAPLPSASITQMSKWAVARAKAILVPSGDHAASTSAEELLVMFSWPAPDSSMT